MSKELTGKCALVTGAGRGIGRAIAISLAQAGASVALVARTKEQLDEVVAEVEAAGGRAIAVVADMHSQSDIEASVATAREAFGSVDILINNAGSNTLGTVTDLDVDVWWSQIEVSLKAPYLYCRAVLPEMQEKGWGRIINMSSILGKMGVPFATAYCSAKHGVIGLTRALAHDVADSGITVNAICPGLVVTALTDDTTAQREKLFGAPADAIRGAMLARIPQKKFLEPDDIAGPVMFLVSSAADRITGQSMTVSGGMIMH